MSYINLLFETVLTACRPVEQLPTGTILVHDIPATTNNTAHIARVSSIDQKIDLDSQLQRLRDYTSAKGLPRVQEVSEIGSGLNGSGKKLIKLLENPSISIIVAEHRGRLTRFGSDYHWGPYGGSGKRGHNKNRAYHGLASRVSFKGKITLLT